MIRLKLYAWEKNCIQSENIAQLLDCPSVYVYCCHMTYIQLPLYLVMPVQLFVKANNQLANLMSATQSIQAGGHGQVSLRITMGQNMIYVILNVAIVDARQGAFPTLRFMKNGLKKRKYPANVSSHRSLNCTLKQINQLRTGN